MPEELAAAALLGDAGAQQNADEATAKQEFDDYFKGLKPSDLFACCLSTPLVLNDDCVYVDDTSRFKCGFCDSSWCKDKEGMHLSINNARYHLKSNHPTETKDAVDLYRSTKKSPVFYSPVCPNWINEIDVPPQYEKNKYHILEIVKVSLIKLIKYQTTVKDQIRGFKSTEQMSFQTALDSMGIRQFGPQFLVDWFFLMVSMCHGAQPLHMFEELASDESDKLLFNPVPLSWEHNLSGATAATFNEAANFVNKEQGANLPAAKLSKLNETGSSLDRGVATYPKSLLTGESGNFNIP